MDGVTYFLMTVSYERKILMTTGYRYCKDRQILKGIEQNVIDTFAEK
jgi:hypothetical protein